VKPVRPLFRENTTEVSISLHIDTEKVGAAAKKVKEELHPYNQTLFTKPIAVRYGKGNKMLKTNYEEYNLSVAHIICKCPKCKKAISKILMSKQLNQPEKVKISCWSCNAIFLLNKQTN